MFLGFMDSMEDKDFFFPSLEEVEMNTHIRDTAFHLGGSMM